MTRKIMTSLPVWKAGVIVTLCVAAQIAQGQTDYFPRHRTDRIERFPFVFRGQDQATEISNRDSAEDNSLRRSLRAGNALPFYGDVRILSPSPEAGVSLVSNEQSFQMVSGGGKACDDCGKSAADCCCPLPDCYCCPQTTGVYVEWLFLQTSGIDMVYAIPQDGIGGPGTAPTGAVGVADHSYENGVRGGIRKCVSDCAAFHLGYTWFESKANDRIAATGGNVLSPVVLLPVPNAGVTAQQASAAYNVRFQLADLDYRYRWECGAVGHVDVVLGGRYGNLKQDFFAQYPFAQPDGSVSVRTDIDFDGGGLRIGLDGERYIHGCSNLKVYGKGFASVLSGQFRSTFVQRNQFGGITAQAQWEDDRFLSILEGEIGVAFEHKCVRMALGYQMAAWFNAVTTPVYVEAVKAFNYVNVSDTITFDGLVARIEFLW